MNSIWCANTDLFLTKKSLIDYECTSPAILFSTTWNNLKISANKDSSQRFFEKYCQDEKTLTVAIPACPDYCQDELWGQEIGSIGSGPSTIALKLISYGMPLWKLLQKRNAFSEIIIYYATQESKDPDHILNRKISPENYLLKINSSIDETQKYLSKLFNDQSWRNVRFTAQSMEEVVNESDKGKSLAEAQKIKPSRVYNLATERQKTYRRVFLHHPELKTNFVQFFRKRAKIDICEHLTFAEGLRRKQKTDNCNIAIFTLSPLSLLSYYNYTGESVYLPILYPEIIE